MIRLPGLAEEDLPAARGWVAELTLLGRPAAVHERVRRTHPGLRATGTIALLRSARDGMARGDETGPPVQGAGELLLTVLATSDGAQGWRAAQGMVPGWDLFKAHGHFIVGAAQPPAARWQARRAYRLAADEYAAGRDGGARGLAALASLAAAVTGRDLGGTRDVRTAVDRLAELEPKAAAELERALDDRGKTLDAGRASALRTDTAGRKGVVGGSAASPPGPTTLERAEHLQKEALRLADGIERAVENAREADRLLAGLDRPPTALTALVGELTRREAWRDALRVLDEQHRAAPEDKEIVHRMARCHGQLGDWPKAKELLTGLMGYRVGERVGIRHMATLQVLCDLAVALGQDHGPEFKKWVEELEVGVPFTHMFVGGPERRAPRTPRTAVHMERRGADGYLNFNPGVDVKSLSEEEHQAHLMAAIAAWLPERERAGLLRDLAGHDPEQTAEVSSLTTRNVADEHFRRGERHFAAGRLDQAQREYETAIEQDPDHAEAWHRLGVVLRYRGQHHLAQAYSEESLAIEPTAHAHALLAVCLLSTGAGPRRAREQYAKALELDPAEEQVREALAKLDEEQPAWPFSRPGSLDATPDRQDYVLGLAMFLGPVAPVDPSRRSSAPPPDVAGVGDAVLAAVRQNEPGGFVHVADDERRASAWIAAAGPHRLVRATLQASFIAEHYHHKDRDIARWKLWTQRMLRLAQALPEDLAAHPSRLGLSRDRLLAYAFSAVADVRIADHQLPEAQACLRRARDLLLADEAVRGRTGAGVPEYDRLFAPRSVLATVLRGLAMVCRRLGDRMAALTYAHEAQRAEEDRPTTRTEVERYVAAGRNVLRQGKRDFGMGAFQEAVRLAEDENPNLVVPVTLINAIVGLGRARHTMGMHRSALACFARARQLEEQTGMSRRATGCHLDIARVLRARPDLGEALGGDARHHAEQELLLASVRDETGAGSEDPLCWTASDGVRYRVTKAEQAKPALLELAGLFQESGEDDTAVQLLTVVTYVADLLHANAADADQRIAIQNEQVGSFAELTRIHFRRADRDGDGDADAFRHAWAAHEAMRARTFLDVLGEAELTVPAEVPAGLVRREAELLARRAGLRAWTGERSPDFWESYREVQG
ncbi:tetratricopeptide repeat protein, partial [Streptomyces sp. NPDC002920]